MAPGKVSLNNLCLYFWSLASRYFQFRGDKQSWVKYLNSCVAPSPVFTLQHHRSDLELSHMGPHVTTHHVLSHVVAHVLWNAIILQWDYIILHSPNMSCFHVEPCKGLVWSNDSTLRKVSTGVISPGRTLGPQMTLCVTISPILLSGIPLTPCLSNIYAPQNS